MYNFGVFNTESNSNQIEAIKVRTNDIITFTNLINNSLKSKKINIHRIKDINNNTSPINKHHSIDEELEIIYNALEEVSKALYNIHQGN